MVHNNLSKGLSIMVNKVIKLLDTTYQKKRVEALNKVCDYYNDGLYKKIRNQAINIRNQELLSLKSKQNQYLDINTKKEKIFPRDLVDSEFKLLDISKQKIINIKITNDEKENYKKGIVNTNSPLVYCLINKKINDIISVRSLDNRKNLECEYQILKIK